MIFITDSQVMESLFIIIFLGGCGFFTWGIAKRKDYLTYIGFIYMVFAGILPVLLWLQNNVRVIPG
jgi:hypothetical protein